MLTLPESTVQESRSFNFVIPWVFFVLLAGSLSGCSGESPASRMKQARQYEQQGDYRKAAIELKQVVQKEPNNVAAHLLLGTVSLRLGEPIYAQQQFERAKKEGASPESVLPLLADSLLGQGSYKKLLATIRIAPSQSSQLQAELLAARGQALLMIKKPNSAAAAFDQALHLVPGQPRALIGQAELALSKDDLTAASEKLDAALNKNPTAMRAWILKGNIAYQQRHYSDAEADYRQAVKAPISDEPPLDKFVTHGRLASVLMQLGKNGEALKEINGMLQAASQSPLPNYLRAVLAYREKHYNLAAEKLQVVLKANPTSPNAQELLGIVKEKQGQNQQAEMYLTGALSADPSSPHLVIALARLQLKMGDSERAISTLNDAVGRGVTSPLVTGMLENLIMSVGQTRQGLAYLQQRLAPEAGNPNVQMTLARAFISHGINGQALALLKNVRASGEKETSQREVLLVTALLGSGRKAEALKTAKAVVDRHPKVALWHNLLGDVEAALQRNDAAREQYLTARRLDPENVGATFGLASLALRQLKFHEAINELRHLRGNSAEPRAMILMAHAYVGLGDQKKAVEILREATKKYPNAPAPLLILVRYELGNHQPQIAKDEVERALKHHPNNAALTNLLGVTQLAAGENKDAAVSFSNAAHEAPTVVAFQLNLARAQIAQGQITSAIKTLSGLRTAHPDNATVLFHLAEARMRNKQPKAAFAIVKSMQEKSHLKGQGDLLEGRLFEMQSNYASAANAFERAAQTLGNGSFLGLAVAAREKGQINPPEEPLLNWVHNHKQSFAEEVLLAQWYSQHDDLRQAASWYRKLARGRGRYVPVMLNNLAMVYLKQHDPRALPTAERAYRLAPHIAAIADTLGWIQLQSGDLRHAAKYLKQAISEDPGNPDMRYHFADLLAKSGKREDALRELTRALETHGAFENRAAAKALKKQLEKSTGG